MKKQYILILLCMILFLAGCGSKWSFSIPFDKFTMIFYNNTTQYIDVQPDTVSPGMKILKEYKENTPKDFTWFINSLLIIKIPIQTGFDIQEMVASNTKNLQLKLLKFKSTDNEMRKVKCGDLQYSWYITAFSYQLDTGNIYGGQYFLMDEEVLYLISLHSENSSDIQNFIKSIKTIKCIK